MTDEPTQHRFMTISQAAEEMNVKQSLIQGLIRTGELRALQVGGRGLWRIGGEDVEDYIADAYRQTAERIAAGELADDALGIGTSSHGTRTGGPSLLVREVGWRKALLPIIYKGCRAFRFTQTLRRSSRAFSCSRDFDPGRT